jgi:hypothetical protein
VLGRAAKLLLPKGKCDPAIGWLCWFLQAQILVGAFRMEIEKMPLLMLEIILYVPRLLLINPF